MLTLLQGKTLKPGELGILVRDPNGTLFDPATISYSIFSESPEGISTLVTPPKMVPVRSGCGIYYVAITIPTNWEGKYKLAWYLQQYPEGPEGQTYEEIDIVRMDPATSGFEAPSMLITSRPGISPKIAQMIVTTRELLSDTDPDRNYHFRPPTPGKVVANYTTRVGFIWTDATITRLLEFSIAQLNTWNPMGLTNYRITTIPYDWSKAAALGAAAKCLTGEAARWTADGFDYSLNGVSLSIQKQGDYQALASTYTAEFETWAALLTANRPCSSGLRQQRWLLG